MKVLALLFLFFVTGISNVRADDMVVHVPGPPNSTALIIGESAMITAAPGSKLPSAQKNESGEISISLDEGQFIIQVGSAEVFFKIGYATIRIKSASLVIAKSSKHWLLQINQTFGNNSHVYIETESEAPQPATEVTTEKPLRIVNSGAAKPASLAEAKQLGDLLASLSKTKSGPLLTFVNIEDPADLKPQKASVNGDDAIEIEDIEIEIEAGCVEICAD